MTVMKQREFDALRQLVRDRYGNSRQPPDVVRALNEHNDRVLEHVEEIAAAEGVQGQDYDLIKTIAILHDIAKADTPLMLHADAGSDDAVVALRDIGKDEDFI